MRGVDTDAEAIEAARALARRLRPELPTGSLRCARLEHMQGERWTAQLGAILLDPVKTSLVEDLRAMTTWIWRRPG